jgi:hypothetical protein
MSKKEIKIELSESEYENLQLIVSKTKDDQMNLNEYYRGVFLAGLEWFLSKLHQVAQEAMENTEEKEEKEEKEENEVV